MITIYDMTSGNLRKEFEEGRQTQASQTPEMGTAVCEPELQLQEIKLESPAATATLPQHLAGVKVEEFIKQMK